MIIVTLITPCYVSSQNCLSCSFISVMLFSRPVSAWLHRRLTWAYCVLIPWSVSSSSTVQRLQVTPNKIFWEMRGFPLFWFLFCNSLLRTMPSFTFFTAEFMIILQQPQIYPHSSFPFSMSNTNPIYYVKVNTYSCCCIWFFLFIRLLFSNLANFNRYCA